MSRPSVAAVRRIVERRQSYLPPSHSGVAVDGQVTRGGVWSAAGVAASALVQLVRSIVFARLLAPADFGVIGLADLFTQFVLLFASFGFNASVVYRKHLDRHDLATCWWGNFFVDSAAAGLCVIVAAVSKQFVSSPEVPVVIALLASQYLLVSLGSVNEALMNRQFMFKANAIITTAGMLSGFGAGLVAVVAFRLGVYGLVFGTIAGTMVTTALRFYAVPWLPSWSWSWRRLIKHLRYGRWFLGVSLLNYANGNADRFFIGASLTRTQLGFYDYASAMPMLVAVRLGTVLNQVLFPAFASLQDNVQELQRLLLQYFRVSALVLCPMMVGLAAVADDFVSVAYGPAWLPIVRPLQIFCIVAIVRIISNPLNSFCNGIGKPWLPFRASLILLPVNAAAVAGSVVWAGVPGAAAAKLLVPLFSLVFVGTPVFRHVRLRSSQFATALLPAMVASLAMAIAVIGATSGLERMGVVGAARLVVLILIGTVAYPAVLMVLWPAELRSLLRVTARCIDYLRPVRTPEGEVAVSALKCGSSGEA